MSILEKFMNLKLFHSRCITIFIIFLKVPIVKKEVLVGMRVEMIAYQIQKVKREEFIIKKMQGL